MLDEDRLMRARPFEFPLIVFGYISAFYFPIFGAAIGGAMFLLEKPLHGILHIALSVIFAVLWYFILFN